MLIITIPQCHDACIPETKTFRMRSGVHMDACRLPNSTEMRAYQTSMMNNKTQQGPEHSN
jgi:hypothetical protein